MRKTGSIIFLFCTFFCSLKAQDEKSDTRERAGEIPVQHNKGENEGRTKDSTAYFHHLEISADTIRNWKNEKAFAYAKYLDSLLKEKQKNYSQVVSTKRSWLSRVLSSAGVEIFFWLLAGIVICFILYKLFLTQGIFRKNNAITDPASAQMTEETVGLKSDFDALIIKATDSGNYRLAVRYQYIKTLYKLDEKNIIKLAADKTNYQYVKEISDLQSRNEFAALTLSYEYIWYGEFAIVENLYRKIESGFSIFNLKISVYR